MDKGVETRHCRNLRRQADGQTGIEDDKIRHQFLIPKSTLCARLPCFFAMADKCRRDGKLPGWKAEGPHYMYMFT